MVNLLLNREIDYAPIHTKAGPLAKGGGTFVVRELVYAYAMWINAAFFLKVIRAYDQLTTKGIVVHEDHVAKFAADPMKMLGIIGEQMQKLMAERVHRLSGSPE